MAGLVVVAQNRMPAAEVEVSAGLVRGLLAAQHPDLARLPVEFLANGWDNALFRVGDGLLARLPRRALGAQIITNEQRWLPVVAPRLPLPVPCPARTGVPGLGLPLPVERGALPAGCAGGAGVRRPGGGRGRRRRVLGALHVPAPADAPANPFRGVPLAERAGTSRPTSPCSPAKLADQSAGTRCCAGGRRRSPPPATTGRRCGCTATCTRRTSW